MAHNDRIAEKLVDYLQDALAMETNVSAMLRSMIATTHDATVKAHLERHLEETGAQAGRLTARLEELDAGGSLRKQVTAMMGAGAKGLFDQFRGDQAGKNARDAYVTESLEIAAYELLLRLADRAGDPETAAVCRENLREEERMRDFIARSWDRFLDMTLVADGVA